eukprot:scaffold113035_cov35-Tisochrysis_lutea.AAC.4
MMARLGCHTSDWRLSGGRVYGGRRSLRKPGWEDAGSISCKAGGGRTRRFLRRWRARRRSGYSRSEREREGERGSVGVLVGC